MILLKCQSGQNKKSERALASVAQWIEIRPANQKVASLIPSQGTLLGCRTGPRWGACERQPLTVSLSFFLPPFPSLERFQAWGLSALRGPCEKECVWLLEAGSKPQMTASEKMRLQSFSCKELNSANIQMSLDSYSFPDPLDKHTARPPPWLQPVWPSSRGHAVRNVYVTKLWDKKQVLV